MGCDPDSLWAMASTLHGSVTQPTNSNPNPAHIRAVVSHGYYACYHEARAYLHESGGDKVWDFIPDPHTKVWNLFSHRAISHIKTGGDGARGHRNTADYHLYKPYSVADMSVAWIVLDKLRSDIKALRRGIANPVPVPYP